MKKFYNFNLHYKPFELENCLLSGKDVYLIITNEYKFTTEYEFCGTFMPFGLIFPCFVAFFFHFACLSPHELFVLA